MDQQSIRQEARRAALDMQSKRRRERAERGNRLEELVVRVVVAGRERDAAVVAAERRAGQALREMTEDEGLSVREAVEWCRGGITAREATRLPRLAQDREMVQKGWMSRIGRKDWHGRPLARTYEARSRCDQANSPPGLEKRRIVAPSLVDS